MSTASVEAPSGRLGALDSLRLLAASLVLVQHLFEGRTGPVARGVAVLEPGVAGVALFFFISGYAIALATDVRSAPGGFLLRRGLRIYPLYLAVLALLLLLGPTGVLPKWRFMADAGALQWLANFALVQEFVGQRAFLGVSWTLIIEMAFYVLFVIGLWGLGRRGVDRLLWLVPTALLALALLSLVAGVRVPLGRPLMIAAAMVGWQCRRWHAGEIGTAALQRYLALFAMVATVATLISFGRFQHAKLDLAQVMLPWAVATAAFLLVMLRLRGVPVLAHGLLPWLGTFSYGVYLLHPLAIEAASVHLPDLRVPAALALTAVLAWAGNLFVERPGMALARRLAATPRMAVTR